MEAIKSPNTRYQKKLRSLRLKELRVLLKLARKIWPEF